MRDQCRSKLHERNLLQTDAMFFNNCGYQLVINITFSVAVTADKKFMICLNQATVRKTLSENT